MTLPIGTLMRAAVSVLAGLAFAGLARATIGDCPPMPGGFTVYLSVPSFNLAPTTQELQDFLNRLQWELDTQRDGKWVRSPTTDVRFVACPKRSPTLDGLE